VNIDEALAMLLKQYEECKDREWIRDPVAYALYMTWKAADDRQHGRGLDSDPQSSLF